MATDVTMPKLSDTMEDGKILRWLKKPGDRVTAGDVLAEVETDKADMELEAEAEGVLSEIVVDEGGSAAVGEVMTLAVSSRSIKRICVGSESNVTAARSPPPTRAASSTATSSRRIFSSPRAATGPLTSRCSTSGSRNRSTPMAE